MRSTTAIAKVVSGFAMLRHVHESNVMSRIIIKVSMNSENQIPPFVTVGVGEGPKIHTWTVPVFILSASNVTALGDEDAFPPEGPMHPLPPYAAHRMGPRHDLPYQGESHVEENDTRMQFD
jgi:hypothetical protein